MRFYNSRNSVSTSLITATVTATSWISSWTTPSGVLSLSFVLHFRVVPVRIVSHVSDDLRPRIRQQDSVLSLDDVPVAALALRVIVAARGVDHLVLEAVRPRLRQNVNV